MQRIQILLIVLLGLFTVGLSANAGVRDGYTVAQFTVPYATTRPVIDGVVNDNEWAGAFSISALLPCGAQAVSGLQARFWMTWDEDNLYMAMRSPLREGERVVQSMRRMDHDYNVVFDDSYELWLDAHTNSPDGQPVFFQFLCNYAGARWDAMVEPAVGNMRPGWQSQWAPKNRITPDKKYWEWEVVVPRQSIYQMTPFTDGFQLRALLCRDFKRPWIQSSLSGQGDFSARDAYPRFILSKSAPAVHLLSVGDPHAQTFGVSLAAYSKQNTMLKWTYATDTNVNAMGFFPVKAGQLKTLPAQLDIAKPGTGDFRIRVTSADGNTSYVDLTANLAFGQATPDVIDAKINDKGDVVSLSQIFNPAFNYVRINGDFIQYDDRASIDHGEVVVKDAQGKTLGKQTLKLDDLAYMQGVLQLGDLAPGQYQTVLDCYDKAGKSIVSRTASFAKKDATKEFPWWNTKWGNIEKVIDPWTPVTYSNGTAGMWGRSLSVGSAGLPAQVTTQGQALLASPMYLVAEMNDGTKLLSTVEKPAIKVLSQADHRTVLAVSSKMGNLQVDSKVTIEFDGMYRIDMTINPQQATAVKSLKLVVPFLNSAADYLHASGEGIRYGFDARFLPKDGTGLLWDCRRVDGQHMALGTFIPYVWVGNTTGGLSWYADNDQGWVPSNTAPAIEVRRDSTKSTDLVFNLISDNYTIDKARTLTFAFDATPVKPMKKGWRMDTWWCDDTFRDFARVEPRGGSVIWANTPFPLDIPESKKFVEEWHNSGKNAVPYFENNNMGAQFIPEVGYFGEEWHSSINGKLWFGKTLTDFMIYSLGEWAKSCNIDGFYVDNVRPEPDDNIEAGRGYRLPDGRVQPTYQTFDERSYYLRMRAAFQEAGKPLPRIVLHSTNNFVIATFGAADVIYDGEANVIFPEMNKDFMDVWPLERLRLDYPGQWGTIVNFMSEFQGSWDAGKLAKAMRSYEGAILLHDALPTGNNPWHSPIADARRAFGIDADDVHFIPYWQQNSGLSSSTKAIYLAGWLRPGKVLIAVVNYGEQTDATVKVDMTKLGLTAPANCKIWDGESKQELTLNADGAFTIPVERHNYRQIIIEPKAQ